ncbi:MAG: citrate/2-methylcitrate synthase [Candidatus Binatales bacterium]
MPARLRPPRARALDQTGARWRNLSVARGNSDGAAMLTAAQAAGVLGVKLGTLYAYVSRGWVKSYRRKIGRQALYRRDDIEALRGVVAPERGRRGRSLPPATSWVTVAQAPAGESGAPGVHGVQGVIVAESAVSAIIEGRLCFRGYPIEELVERASFEEVCLLLWGGERPRPEDAAALAAEVSGARIPDSVASVLLAVGQDAPPVWKLAAVMPSLAALERHQRTRPRIRQAISIVSVLPLALAEKAAPDSAQEGSGTAARLLSGARGAAPADWEIHALDHMLVACAEHELNASTFAARVVASTGADLYASVLAALCSMSGPIHGGACDRIERLFDALSVGAKIDDRLDDRLDRFAREEQLPPGFGHAIYPEGDPRAALLKSNAVAIARRKGRRLLETALKIEQAVWKRNRLRPNLDFYLTVCARMLGFPQGLSAAIFAVGRTAGWIAHSLEQYADNRLIRPRMRYRGAELRHWA